VQGVGSVGKVEKQIEGIAAQDAFVAARRQPPADADMRAAAAQPGGEILRRNVMLASSPRPPRPSFHAFTSAALQPNVVHVGARYA